MSKRAVRMAGALALVALTGVVAVSLLMAGADGARAFEAGASDGDMPIPAQYTEQCSNGVAVPNPGDNAGLVGDCAVLLAARDALVGTTGSLSWSAGVAIGDWDGVAIANKRVSELDLSDKGLDGAIPAELGSLANLTSLRLWDNSLTGNIPAELGSLANLRELWISNNRLTGEVPAELGGLASLSRLVLNDNRLTGAIPAELGGLANLEWLYLSANQLTGEIPAWLGNLARLDLLSLSDNRLTGEIPAELGGLDNLTYVFLHGNQLTGCVPASLRGHMTPWEMQRIELRFCDDGAGATSVATLTPTATATSVPGATATATATAVAGGEVLGKLDELERRVGEDAELSGLVAEIVRLVAALVARVAELEGSDMRAATATPTHTPTATPVVAVEPSPTLSPTPTSVAGAGGEDACVTALAGSGSVRGSWSGACLSANSPDSQTYYARFYTFTLDAASEVTITLSSDDAAPYLYLLEGAGTDGAINQHKGAATASSAAITASLGAGAYTIEATTWGYETGGDFTLEVEIAR